MLLVCLSYSSYNLISWYNRVIMKYKFSLPKNREDLLAIGAKVSTWGVFAMLFGSIAVLAIFIYYSSIVPAPDKLTNRKVEQSTKIYDRNDILLYEVYKDENRTLINLQDVSPYVVYATLSAEDADFYKHQGFDPIGMIRGALLSLTGQGLQSGSTLTQQLTKNALLSSEQRIDRKIKEFILSMQVENKYNKDDILEWYLNETPYGSTAYGIEEAAQLYFNKTSADLDLAESAYLAGLPQRPSAYSPFGATPEYGFDRQKYVLKLMYERGWIDSSGERKKISKEEYDTAINEELQIAQVSTDIRAPHFVFYVLDKLYEKYGEEYVKSAGLRVKTTLDVEKQEEIQTIVQEELDKAEEADLNVGNAAVMGIDPQSRDILVMVGSRDYFDTEGGGQFNVATSPTRQPGSSIKPLVYATGLKQGYTASTMFMDVPTNFGAPDDGSKAYQPKNYDGKFRGPIQLRYALANSINITAVKMLQVVGIPSLLETAKDFGITSYHDDNYYGLSLALGGGEASLIEMTNAFSVFASGGYFQAPNYILQITDKDGNNIAYDVQRPKKQVLEPGIAYIMSDILSDNSARLLAFGPGNQLEFRTNQVAVKTGTTDDIKDNWTIGFTNDIAIGVWSGNNDNTPMNSRLASGVTGAAPIWNRAITTFLDDSDSPAKFEKPDNVVKIEVGTITGGIPADGLEDKRWEYFVKGTEPEVRSEMVLELEVCEKDGKLANDDCKDDDKTEKREYIKLTTLLSEWQDSANDWIKENYPKDKDEFKKFYPPTEKSDYKKD